MSYRYLQILMIICDTKNCCNISFRLLNFSSFLIMIFNIICSCLKKIIIKKNKKLQVWFNFSPRTFIFN